MPDGAGRGASGRVLLAALPFDAGRFPSLALSLLKAGLTRQGIGCDVRYLSLEYIDRVGKADFARLNSNDHSLALLGEWVFAEAAHGADAAPADPFAYLTDVLEPECGTGRFSPALVRSALAARAGADAFVDSCVSAIDWSRYAVLGLSTSFQQNMASLAFARRVKARHPHLLVVLGGPNCAGDMGEELHLRYEFLDVVCQAEGDRVFPALVTAHLNGEAIPDLPGIIRRAAGGTSLLPAQPVDQIEDLDTLPFPDHSDFYAQRRGLRTLEGTPPGAVFETARGCWWGMKHHCTFCGLNGRAMSYRSKSQARAYDELVQVVDDCGSDVLVTDAILDLDYFKEFLPRVAEAGPDITAFWQMKVNLRPAWIEMLAAAGITRIQPGIEALDTDLLTLMRKGCTMLQNVQTMKLAAESGISVRLEPALRLPWRGPGELRAHRPAAAEAAPPAAADAPQPHARGPVQSLFPAARGVWRDLGAGFRLPRRVSVRCGERASPSVSLPHALPGAGPDRHDDRRDARGTAPVARAPGGERTLSGG